IVPTPLKNCGPFEGGPGIVAEASITKTSSSGSVNRRAGSQLRARRSSKWPLTELNLTMIPTSGPFTPWRFVSGFGVPPGRVTPLTEHGGAIVLFAAPFASLHGASSLIVAVRLPEWKAAAYTWVPL